MHHFAPAVALAEGQITKVSTQLPCPAGADSRPAVDADADPRFQRLDASRQCILVIDPEGRPVWLNAEARQASEAGNLPAAVGQPWVEYWPETERIAVESALDSARVGIPARFVAACQNAAKSEAHWDVNVTPDGPRIAGRPSFTAYLLNVTDQRIAARELHRAAMHDGLTGLANRTLFYDSLDRMIEGAEEGGKSFALVAFDLDRFKQINERLGHHGGDALLRGFAARLATLVPAGGLAARFGGDEFVLLMPVAGSHDETRRQVESILEVLCCPYPYDARTINCTASAGIAIYPHAGHTPDELFQNADMALLAGKAREPGRALLFSGDMRQEMQRRASSLEVAADALHNDWIEPHYQPKVDLSTGRLCGLEALLRWRQPGGSWQSPATISAAFDDRSLATKITDTMFRKVVLDLQRWMKFGCAVPVAVNASAADFLIDDFAGRLLALLDRSNVPPSLIELEVTEGVFLGRDAPQISRVLQQLSDSGIRIALDDFGTGYASLTHLKQFPVQVIKIDRSFVGSLENSHDDRVIVRTMIDLGRSMSIEVVAEGIESQAQLSFIKDTGGHVGQGFWLSKPMPAGEIEMALLDRSAKT
jgi:diguanylate cyclase (GGDEF)-like protein